MRRISTLLLIFTCLILLLPAAGAEGLETASIGDYVFFGTYEQDNIIENGAEPIEWIVLDQQGDDFLLLSRYGLDYQYFSDGRTTWEKSSLRAWLNSTFLDTAFSERERQAIRMSEIDNSQSQCYSNWGTTGGNNTWDRVFALSYAEAQKYCGVGTENAEENSFCRAEPTAYVTQTRGFQGFDQSEYGDVRSRWWVRTPGEFQNHYAFIDEYWLNSLSDWEPGEKYSVYIRPAIWINGEKLKDLITGMHSFPIDKEWDGEYLYFGNYEQDRNQENGKEEIEWMILARQGDCVFLLSKYVLDSYRYKGDTATATWEDSYIRTWLNDSFLNDAFSTEEQAAILTTMVDNSDNQGYCGWNTTGGNNTADQIFLLSYAEANKYLGVEAWNSFEDIPNIRARAAGTEVASRSSSYRTSDGLPSVEWWLRSPGNSQGRAAFVYKDGTLVTLDRASWDYLGVRPAMWVNLQKIGEEKGVFSYNINVVRENAKIVPLEDAEIGDSVSFGSYEQDNSFDNGAEPIEWQVLDKQGSKLLLLSRYGLDAQQYGDSSWEYSTLCRWLNEDFLQSAFSAEEQEKIVSTGVYRLPGKNSASQQVSLLSESEVLTYLGAGEPSMCEPTAYAIAQNAFTNSRYTVNGTPSCFWWLCDRCIDLKGNILHTNAPSETFNDICVRPAIWVDTEPDEDKSITFGHYEQDDVASNGKESIEWDILDFQENKMLLISKFALETRKYDENSLEWEKCSLRSWMNDVFLQSAFTPEEQERILIADVFPDGEAATQDKVFLLSEYELDYLHNAGYDHAWCTPTAYATAQGANVDYMYHCSWWLRSKDDTFDMIVVLPYGNMMWDPEYVSNEEVCVRPAIWVDVSVYNEYLQSLQSNK